MSYIDREKCCKEFCNNYKLGCDKSKCPLFKTPTEDVAPIKHGYWTVQEFVGEFNNLAHCSNCGESIETTEYEPKFVSRENPYCHNCGSKMDLESGEGR